MFWCRIHCWQIYNWCTLCCYAALQATVLQTASSWFSLSIHSRCGEYLYSHGKWKIHYSQSTCNFYTYVKFNFLFRPITISWPVGWDFTQRELVSVAISLLSFSYIYFYILLTLSKLRFFYLDTMKCLSSYKTTYHLAFILLFSYLWMYSFNKIIIILCTSLFISSGQRILLYMENVLEKTKIYKLDGK